MVGAPIPISLVTPLPYFLQDGEGQIFEAIEKRLGFKGRWEGRYLRLFIIVRIWREEGEYFRL